MAVAMSALLLLLLLVAPPPDSSEAAVQLNRPKIVKWIATNARSSAADSFSGITFDLAVGTPPQALSFVMDITEQLVWAQCREPAFTQSQAPIFRPGRSFAPIGCDDKACQSLPPDNNCTDPDDHCKYRWDIHTGAMSGYLATETFNFGAKSVPGMVFGCSDKLTLRGLRDVSGIAGFSRGPLSLVSQLHISKFSYFIDGKSFLSLGDADAAPAKGNNSTPLLAATPNQECYLYYVNLTGILVDSELLADIKAGTFAVQEDGSGGAYLSTTESVTFLQEAAYMVVRQELVSRIRSQGVAPVNTTDDDILCFGNENLRNVKVPRLALVFDGAGEAMELNVRNYFSVYSDYITCLIILPSPSGTASLGSLLQTGRTMTYDIHGDGGQLTFGPVAAGAPALAHAGAPAQAPAHAGARAPPARASLVITATLLAWALLFQQQF